MPCYRSVNLVVNNFYQRSGDTEHALRGKKNHPLVTANPPLHKGNTFEAAGKGSRAPRELQHNPVSQESVRATLPVQGSPHPSCQHGLSATGKHPSSQPAQAPLSLAELGKEKVKHLPAAPWTSGRAGS